MPVTREIETKEGKILLWEVSENSSDLELMCRSKQVELPPPMHLESRRKQVMVTSLLHQMLFPGTILDYEATGKPFVNSDQFVSVSHSANVLVMMRSTVPCGVDIERVHSRVRKVSHKFLNDEELRLNQDASDYKLTQLWTAKEAMFKVSGSDKVFMRSNIFVETLSATEATAVLTDGELKLKRRIRFLEEKDMILAWTERINEG